MRQTDDEKPDHLQERSAAFLTLGGGVTAFGVASCCALPAILTTAGIGSAWLGGIAALSAPYRTSLVAISLIALVVSATLLWRLQRNARTCPVDKRCTPVWVRIGLLFGLIFGFVLLAAGYFYA